MSTAPALFTERQRPHAWTLVAILLPGVGLPVYIFVQQLLLGRPFGNHPMTNWGLAILMPAIVVLMSAMACLHLDTRLDADRLRVRLFPLADENLHPARIVRWEVRTYSPMKEYWGWGVRFGADGSVAYTMKGNRDVQLLLDDGSRVLIGSQRPENLASALTMAAPAAARTRS